MKYKIKFNFFSVVIALIIGGTMYKQFDFQSFSFEKPALAIVYLIVFIFSIASMVKKSDK